MVESIHLTARSVPFGEFDRESAYKCLPIPPDGAGKFRIVPMPPRDSNLYVSRATAHVFGWVASVIHYNALSLLLVSQVNRISLTPTIGIYDDLGFLAPSSTQGHATQDSDAFFAFVGVNLKISKCAISPSSIFLGIRGDFPSVENRMSLHISPHMVVFAMCPNSGTDNPE